MLWHIWFIEDFKEVRCVIRSADHELCAYDREAVKECMVCIIVSALSLGDIRILPMTGLVTKCLGDCRADIRWR